MKKAKKIASLALAALMGASALSVASGCQGGGAASSAAPAAASSQAAAASSEAAPASSAAASSAAAPEGKVLNIYVWNNEFQSRFNTYYPEVQSVAKDLSTTTLKDGTTVKWTINASDNNNYQNKLDAALQNQDSAAADDKIDIFLVEADYALKYVNSDYTLDVKKDIGLTDDDLSQQYKYTKDIVTDKNGAQKGTTWQATPGLFAYRRSYAKKILGTDDPTKVQDQLSDWNKFATAAEKAKAQGYKMLSGYDDSFRVFSNNVSAPFVSGTTITIDPNIMNWVKQTKDFTEKGYNNKTHGLFGSTDWSKDQGPTAKVFGFFYSTWGINFTLEGNSLAKPTNEGGKEQVGNGAFGDWAVCPGPQSWYWGGTWICGCKGSDNLGTINKVMKALTCNKDIMKQITLKEQDYTNNQAAMEEVANSDFKSPFLGGQNHIKLFADAAKKIDMSKSGPYDQGITDSLKLAFVDYFNGTIDEAKAKANFEKAIKEKYPELTDVKWPS